MSWLRFGFFRWRDGCTTKGPCRVGNHISAWSCNMVKETGAQINVVGVTAHALIYYGSLNTLPSIRNSDCITAVGTTVPNKMTYGNNKIIVTVMTPASTEARTEPRKCCATTSLDRHNPTSLTSRTPSTSVARFIGKTVI